MTGPSRSPRRHGDGARQPRPRTTRRPGGRPAFVTDEERARMAYGDGLDRLAGLKAEYDPENCCPAT